MGFGAHCGRSERQSSRRRRTARPQRSLSISSACPDEALFAAVGGAHGAHLRARRDVPSALRRKARAGVVRPRCGKWRPCDARARLLALAQGPLRRDDRARESGDRCQAGRKARSKWLRATSRQGHPVASNDADSGEVPPSGRVRDAERVPWTLSFDVAKCDWSA